MTPLLSILTIVGPTAAGKTAYAIGQALERGGEIISVDSRQVYRGFVIGTAQPTAEEQAQVRHHLINCLDPGEKITAGRYVELVHGALADIVARGKTPILCGGTGLYIRALRLGLAELGDADPNLRCRVAARIRREGAEAVYAEFAALDPDYAATFHPNNTRRLSRALEILEATGKPPSQVQGWRKGSGGYGETPIVTIEGLGEVSKNWKTKKLKYVSAVQTGITLGKKHERVDLETRSYLRVANVQDGYLDLEEIAEVALPIT
ncbi:MAG: tRNA (adenosine(37)-N6)-dimethylallyltransferase MiaA, partial [Candidatus Marinimicrobia bacterium]|nr:tRNA (adenosine(37)-N6)-dimethylallyltransferase MiaA [Candidatus Neomarinimicrobiota bacterium]